MSLPLVARWLIALGAGLLCAAACVRANPPSEFTCSSLEDCSDGETCLSGYCRPRGYCNSEYDCDQRIEVCRDHSCVVVECKIYEQSACGNYRCDLNSYACRTSCVDDNACQNDTYCRNGECVVDERLVPLNGRCSSTSRCESGSCCARPSGSVCRERCEPEGSACSGADDCRDGYCCPRLGGNVCARRECPPECLEDDDCDDDQRCQSGKCVAKLANGEPCQGAVECRSGRCLSGKCAAAVGDSCDDATDCSLEQTCCVLQRGGTRQCAAASAACLAETGASCDVSADCVEGLCEGGIYCTKDCNVSSDCGKGAFGVPNVCVKYSGVGTCLPGCTIDEQCSFLFGYYVSCDAAQRYCTDF